MCKLRIYWGETNPRKRMGPNETQNHGTAEKSKKIIEVKNFHELGSDRAEEGKKGSSPTRKERRTT